MSIKRIFLIAFALVVVGAYPAMAADIPVAAGESIQAAIDVAGEGDRILVAAGTFNEPLLIDGKKDLKIIGAGATDTIIDGTLVMGPLIEITDSSDIQVKKLTAAGAGNADSGIYIDVCRNVLIKKCVITGAFNDGISYYRGVGLTITESTVTGNAGVGIGFFDYSWKNVITLNTVTANAAYGIYHQFGNEDLIEENTVSGNGLDGIYNGIGGPLEIKNNTVTENAGFGIADNAVAGYLNKINKNTVTLNGDGIYVNQAIKVKKNKVTENSIDGIVAGGFGNLIMENKVKANGGNGILAPSANNWIEANVVDGNLGGNGIFAAGLGSQILNNEVTNNTGTGVFNTNEVATISGNFVDGNGSDGIFPVSNSLIVTDNISTNNAGYGILYDGSHNTILRNKVKLNGSVGMGGGICETCVIKNNNVRRNDGDGIRDIVSSKVARNVVAKNVEDGIDAAGLPGNWIKNNDTFENGDGLATFDLADPTDPPDDYWQGNTYGTTDVPTL